MFRTITHCDRYEFVPFELDTPITIPGANADQKKIGYNFTINDRTSYHDWYKAYLKIRFKVVKNDSTNFDVANRIAPISDAASLISNLKVFLNGKSLYDCFNTYDIINIKNPLNKSIDYTKSIATNEFYYPDEDRSSIINKNHANYNKGFHDRQFSIVGDTEVNAIIPLNKFSFFEGLENNILPPSQVRLEIRLTEDSTALFKADDLNDEGKVVVTKLVLWVPRLNLKAEGMRLVMERYLSPNTTWSYLCETTSESTSGRHVDRTWQITSSVIKPRHVFVYLQKSDENVNQNENVHILDTFNIGEAKLISARLEVGSGVFYRLFVR